MNYCLRGNIQCAYGQIVYSRHDSVIRCDAGTTPIMAYHNTENGIARAATPKLCPYHQESVEVAAKLTTPNWTGRHSVIPKAQKSHKRMFSKEQIRDIRTRAENGETYGAIAKSYGANGTTIGNVVNRVTYKDVG